MIRALSFVLAALLPHGAAAQLVNPGVLPDQLAARVAQAMPPVCAGAPPSDTPLGTAGVAAPCTRRGDAAAATLVMPASATTASDGSFSGTWPGAFVFTPTTAMAAVKSTSDPYICQVIATTTTCSGKCWRAVQTMTLPTLAGSLLGLVLTPQTPAAAGLTVMVVGRQ